MKLIDLLVKELPKRGGWPQGALSVAQDNNGYCWGYKCDQLVLQRHELWRSKSGFAMCRGKVMICEMASDWNSSFVTKSQYESALAKNDGWIEWGGGECPVEEGTLVDVRYRDGQELSALPANDIAPSVRDASHDFCHNDGRRNDIITYRLHKPEINSRTNDDRLEQDLNECIGQDVDMPEWSGDGVPPIGCACEMQDSKGAWLPVDIIAKNDGFTFGWSYDYRLVFFGDKADEFRPLRTEAEKAREKLAASLHIAAGASPIELNGIGPLYFELADAIISGSVFGTTFKADK